MHWMNKLERKLGKYAIKHLIVYILVAYAVGYVILLFSPELYNLMEMNPALICQGQVWRLITWVCTVPQSPSIFLIFMFMLYYWIGNTLEQVWGAFRYNVFIFMGLILMTVGPMIIYLISGLIAGFDNAINLSASTYYLNLTSFLAFATIFPNQQVTFMFILPIKIKWLAIVDAIYLGYVVLANLAYAIRTPDRLDRMAYLSQMVMILLSVMNYLIYFFSTRNYKKFSPKETKRKRKYHKAVRQATARGTRHYCAVCGRTEETNPELSFRFCSKCRGNLEYCNEHLFTHEHRK